MLGIRKAPCLLAMSFLTFAICAYAHKARIGGELDDVEGHDGYWRDKKSRQRQAEKWREEFKKLDAQLATLSPEEEHWLKVEIDDQIASSGTYTKRALDAMDSREYDLRVSKPHVALIICALNNIATCSLGARYQKDEIKYWTELACLFMDFEFWQSVDDLVSRNIVQKAINGVTANYYTNHVGWAQQILNEIVIRYLRGHLVE